MEVVLIRLTRMLQMLMSVQMVPKTVTMVRISNVLTQTAALSVIVQVAM